MKAALNGVLNLSIPDGWWPEGFNGSNGWSIGDMTLKASTTAEDTSDAEALYRLLEDEVIPLYYERGRNILPLEWISMMKQSIRSIVPLFSTRRMLKEYCEQMYLPAARQITDKQA